MYADGGIIGGELRRLLLSIDVTCSGVLLSSKSRRLLSTSVEFSSFSFNGVIVGVNGSGVLFVQLSSKSRRLLLLFGISGGELRRLLLLFGVTGGELRRLLLSIDVTCSGVLFVQLSKSSILLSISGVIVGVNGSGVLFVQLSKSFILLSISIYFSSFSLSGIPLDKLFFCSSSLGFFCSSSLVFFFSLSTL